MTHAAPQMAPARLNLRKNVSFAIAEFLLNIALVFVSYRLVIINGGLEAVGVWATLYAWTTLIRLGDAGMANATLRFVALRDIRHQAEEIRTYAQTGILANAALFLVLSAIGYLAMAPLVPALVGPAHETEAARTLPLLFTSFLLLNISGAIMGALQGLHLGYRRSQLSVAGTMLQLLMVSTLVPSMGLMGLALAQIIQYGAVAIVAWLMVRHATQIKAPLPLRFDPPAFRDMLGYSLKAQVANIANGLFEPLSKILVAAFGGMVTQGLYELAFKTIWLTRNAVISGVTAALPAMTALLTRDKPAALSAYRTSHRLTALALAPLLAAAAIASPLISQLWLGRLDWTFVQFAALLACGAFFSGWGANAYNLSLATGRMRNNVVVNMGLLITLVLLGSLAGAALGGGGVIAAIAATMAAGGIIIKPMNERLLSGPRTYPPAPVASVATPSHNQSPAP